MRHVTHLKAFTTGAIVGIFTLFTATAADWQPLFNGENLDGWAGDPRLWKVQDGTILGETNGRDSKAEANTFLIWEGGEPENFELEFQARVTGSNNSGVQYRSRLSDPEGWKVVGYQMDLHPQPNYLGMLYEEGGRGIACENGQRVELDEKPTVKGQLERPDVELGAWNDYRIEARGTVLKHYVNDVLVAETHDVSADKRASKGVIALQLHAGQPMKVEFKELRLRPLEAAAPEKPAPKKTVAQVEPTISWIWQNASPKDNERVFFRREFELPTGVTSASITVTCDNWQRLWVNGKDLGFSGDWAVPASHDVTELLRPGARNVIAVEGRNQEGIAAMALRLRVTLKDERQIHLVSDEKWLASLEASRGWQQPGSAPRGWKPAVAVGTMGDQPWDRVIVPEVIQSKEPQDVTEEFNVTEGFRLERLYQVPTGQGSWVAMTVDGEGRLLCADQYGKIYRVTPAEGSDGKTEVEALEIPLSGAHGLLWRDGILYVVINEGEDQSGVWLVADNEPTKPRLLKAMTGRGEHGPHSLVPSPDGQWIYFVAGNFTDLPEMDASHAPPVWQEDQLLPRRPDAKGHARERMAPGGWVARFRPDGTQWELVASGFRNSFDIAFNAAGDLFAYDADMEYDFGMPWYRPTRICHVVPGAEFGWRNGTGKWPSYYEDSMESQFNIGPGSPTGLVSGIGAKFPAKYQKAIFALDWTYATIHAIHLTPDGLGYEASGEEFLAGTGLPLTDAEIGSDGAMYFLTGGRRTTSALWRVVYEGDEPTTPLSTTSKSLEHLPLVTAWEGLASTDRVTRYRSRLALEVERNVPALTGKLAIEPDPWRVIGGSLALARIGTIAQRNEVLDALDRLDWLTLDSSQRINWLRACGLIFIRQGEPKAEERAKILAKIDAAFPSNHRDVDRELCRMLSYLQAPGIVGRTLAMMDAAAPDPAPDWLALVKRNAKYGSTVEEMIANFPPEQVIHYIYCLSVVKGPWNESERMRFLAWIDRLAGGSGGASYGGFIADLREQTLANATPEERARLQELAPAKTSNPLANLPPVKGPGREWSVDQVVALAAEGLEDRDLENGRKMYQASLCAACHRFGSEGGAAGPDLTASGGRFAIRDLVEAIVDPGKEVSDQYAFDTIIKTDGTQLIGKLIEEKDEHWVVATSPFDFTQTAEIERNEIKDIKPSPISPMPPGLINRLNPDELKDLLAYLLGK